MQYGRRSPKNAPAIRLTPLLTGVLPTHPPAADYLAKLKGWQMLGNDQYGDCVAVTWANIRRLVTAALAGKESYPSLAEVEALYKTQNPDFPSQDDGMDIQTCLEYLVKHGGPDGIKALGFAKVDHTNFDEVEDAIAIFGSVWTGVNVLQANMDDFNAGRPWDYYPYSPVDGGHSVITGGYDDNPSFPFITWAEETEFRDAFWTHEVEEAWVVIWPEMLKNPDFLAGMNLAQFAADYKAITGKDFPVVVPPTPAPTPAPSFVKQALQRALAVAKKELANAKKIETAAAEDIAELEKAFANL